MVPAIMYGTILTFNQFNVIYFITAGGPLGKTEILVTQAFKLVNPGGLYGVAAAFSVMVFFILLIITLARTGCRADWRAGPMPKREDGRSTASRRQESDSRTSSAHIALDLRCPDRALPDHLDRLDGAGSAQHRPADQRST